jgi:hypothetical protein
VPKINWQSLPLRIKQHLIERLRKRDITQDDLESLKLWIAGNPEVPEGPWCKEFGSFTLAGDGRYPKTFLMRNQPCAGKKL